MVARKTFHSTSLIPTAFFSLTNCNSAAFFSLSSSHSMELRCPRARSIVIFISAMLAFGYAGAEERRCSFGRIEKLLRIRCYDMNLREVPQNLKASVEVSNTIVNQPCIPS